MPRGLYFHFTTIPARLNNFNDTSEVFVFSYYFYNSGNLCLLFLGNLSGQDEEGQSNYNIAEQAVY